MLKEQQGTEDTYVYFQYCWWDESGEESGVNGPRSRAEPELFSSSAENGILNRVKTENAVIPIDGQEHARPVGQRCAAPSQTRPAFSKCLRNMARAIKPPMIAPTTGARNSTTNMELDDSAARVFT